MIFKNNQGLVFRLFRFLRRIIKPVNIWYVRYHLKLGTIIPLSKLDDYLNVANKVLIKHNYIDFHIGLGRPDAIDFKGYIEKRANWPKYERFLKNNNIRYSFYNLHNSSWQKDANKFDIIIWDPNSEPHILEEAKSKIYFLEKYLKKNCYPSVEEIWSYEDKVRASFLYKHFGLPAVPTFSTNSKIDALEFLNKTSFPIISKISTGSSSMGILKLNNKKSSIKYVNSCFSDNGRKTYWPYIRQKNYVYFQKFIDDTKYDLRIIVVGDKLFGYYRYAKAGDFRASGAGIVEKKALPEEAMEIAINTKKMLKSTALAVDMLYSEKERKYNIIETSIVFGVETAEQLVIDGHAGFYEYSLGKFTFKEGRFWIQELALQDYFNSIIK